MARTSQTTTGRDQRGEPARTPADPSADAASISDGADAGLVLAGQPGIAWAERAMPVLGMLRTTFAVQQPFAGLKIAACLHVTAETAVLVRTLAAGGARVELAASNPLSTQDDIAAAMAAEPGVTVYARSGVDRDTYYEHIHRALDSGPDLVMDDGGGLVTTLHGDRPA